MRPSLLAPAGLCVLLFTGCGGGGPTLDASSDESLEASVHKVEASLDAPKRARFHRAISVLILKSSNMDTAEEKKFKQETFDGKNADQIIATGEAAESTLTPSMKEMLNQITK